MRLVLAGLVLACSLAYCQILIPPSQIARAAKLFEPDPADRPLRCKVAPVPARLTFGFRFQSGYSVALPMKQLAGPGHRLSVITKVTPEGKDSQYLAVPMRLPNVPATKEDLEFGGAYLLGEGRYQVEWLLYDETNRVCRKNWRVEARLNSAERGVKIGIDANTVAPISFRRWSGSPSDVRPLRRLTVWLHAAPMFARSTKFRPQDRGVLLSSLASVLESLPATSVKVVVFNLDQQRELFRQDDLTPESFDQVAQSMNNVELGLVDYKILQNRRGHIDLLADLINEESNSDHPAEAVVLLGPSTRYGEKIPRASIDPVQGGAPPPFFYLELKPFMARAEVPDSLEWAIGRAKGRTIVIRTPSDFAKAIRQVRNQVAR